jgi:hypothetical protein
MVEGGAKSEETDLETGNSRKGYRVVAENIE